MTTSKKIALAGIGALGVLALAAWAALGAAESRAAERIRAAAAEATGTGATIGAVEIDPFAGTFAFRDLRILNPEGFSGEPFLVLARCEVGVGPGGLSADVVDLGTLEIHGLRLGAEFAGGSLNLMKIKENVEASREARGDEGTRRFLAREIRVRGTKVAGAIAVLPRAPKISVDLDLDDVVLRDVGVAEGGVPMPEITRAIVQAVVREAIGELADKVPGLEGRLPGPDRGRERESRR